MALPPAQGHGSWALCLPSLCMCVCVHPHAPFFYSLLLWNSSAGRGLRNKQTSKQKNPKQNKKRAFTDTHLVPHSTLQDDRPVAFSYKTSATTALPISVLESHHYRFAEKMNKHKTVCDFSRVWSFVSHHSIMQDTSVSVCGCECSRVDGALGADEQHVSPGSSNRDTFVFCLGGLQGVLTDCNLDPMRETE